MPPKQTSGRTDRPLPTGNRFPDTGSRSHTVENLKKKKLKKMYFSQKYLKISFSYTLFFLTNPLPSSISLLKRIIFLFRLVVLVSPPQIKHGDPKPGFSSSSLHQFYQQLPLCEESGGLNSFGDLKFLGPCFCFPLCLYPFFIPSTEHPPLLRH